MSIIRYCLGMREYKVTKQLGKRIRKLRKEQKLSQEELGIKAQIHRTYIGSVERGEQNISIENIGKLSKALRCKPKDLFDF